MPELHLALKEYDRLIAANTNTIGLAGGSIGRAMILYVVVDMFHGRVSRAALMRALEGKRHPGGRVQ